MKYTKLKLKVFRGQSGFNKIKEHWSDLFQNLQKPVYTQSPIWHYAYIKHLCTNSDSCFYFCIFDNDKLIAIYPLEQTRHRYFFLRLNSLSFSEHSHFGLNSVIVEDEEDIQYLFNFLYKTLKNQKDIKWNLIYLEQALDGTSAASCMVFDKKLSLQSVSSNCNVLAILNQEETATHLTKNFKNNLKKARKKLQKIDNVEYRTCTEKHNIDACFEQFLTVEASGWKGSEGKSSAIKLNTNLREFYKQVMTGFSEFGQMEINILMVNEKPIAVQYAIILANTVFLLKIGYDEQYSKVSPGNMLLEEKLKSYLDQPHLKNVNLITDASWHRSWQPEVINTKNIYNCRNSFIAIYFKIMLFIRKIVHFIKK